MTTTTRDAATDFIIRCVTEIVGTGFHPDNDFTDYIDGDGKPLFDAVCVDDLNASLASAFEVLGDEVYDVGLAAMDAVFAGAVN